MVIIAPIAVNQNLSDVTSFEIILKDCDELPYLTLALLDGGTVVIGLVGVEVS